MFRPAAFFCPIEEIDAGRIMHILYIDDSGTADDPNERYFVLGAVAVFERGLFHQIKAADDCVAGFNLGGRFSAVFLLQCLEAIGCDTIHLTQ